MVLNHLTFATMTDLERSLVQLLERTSKEKNDALQRKAASLEDQLKRQKVNDHHCNEDFPPITNARQFIIIYTFLALQGDLETKETGLQEKEVVIQKLQNNLSHRQEELKVSNVSS